MPGIIASPLLLVVIPFGVNLPALTAVAMLLMVLPFLLNRFLC